MAQPLKALPESGTAAETPPISLVSSKRHAHATHQALHRVEEPATPIQSHEDNIDVEFERKKLSITRRSDPIVRVAAFLVAVSRQNEHEGRDAAIVCDSLQCGAAAEFLGLDLDILSRVLVTLQDRGLVDPDNAGRLRLRDIDGLERIADYEHQGAGSLGLAGRIAVSPQPILSSSLRWLANELRDLSWLLCFVTSLSIVCVGFGAIVAMAIFE